MILRQGSIFGALIVGIGFWRPVYHRTTRILVAIVYLGSYSRTLGPQTLKVGLGPNLN